MRIIGGSLKSRLFTTPSGKRTHPMGEKIRGAIFNALGELEGVAVLDAYAGSGALSFEAISRGAKSVIAIDIDKKAYKTLAENVENLNLEERVKATRANCSTWVKNNSDLKFGLVFVDPPYYDVNPKHIEELSEMVEVGGAIIISHPAYYHPKLEKPKWELLSQKKYANANVSIFRKLK